MKVVISNKQYFEELFEDCTDKNRYFTTKEIHSELYNRVNISFNTEYKIDTCILISYKKIGDGDCIFSFVGKNKDLFFYEFQGTVS